MPFSIAGPASSALPSLDGINRATDRISSGLRIDYQQNAAEAAITGRLDTVAGENTISIRNAINQSSALQKADQTLGQGTELVERIAALTVQAGNGALGTEEVDQINTQVQGLLDEFADSLENASFNGNDLFGEGGIDIEALKTRLDTLRQSPSDVSSDELDQLSAELTEVRATVGAEQAAIGRQVDQLESESVNIASSRSRLSDADLATEIVNLLQEQTQFEASVKVFNQQRLAEESILNLLS